MIIMNKSVIFLTIFLLSSIATQAFSMNICEEGSKGLRDTDAIFSQYFDSYIKDHNTSGNAKVYDVHPAPSSSTYKIQLDCGNNIKVFITSSSAFLKDLRVGQKVSFSGDVNNWRKRYYIDTRKPYIEFIIDSGSVSF